jgi:hypothetical protein
MSYVYVITDDPIESEHMETVSVVKIGFTSDPNIYNRVRQLQTGNPRPLSIVEIHEFENQEMAKSIERLCHWNLKNQGLTGEWFLYSGRVKEVLAYLSRLSNYYSYENLNHYFSKKGIKNG